MTFEEKVQERIAFLNSTAEAAPVEGQAGEKRAYTVKEIQNILDISQSTAYALIQKRLFKSVKVGKQIRIPKKSFDAWLDA